MKFHLVYCKHTAVGFGDETIPLDTKSSVMKHVTVTRILLIVVLGCAVVSVYWALQMKSECMTLCSNIPVSPVPKVDDYDAKLPTTLSPSLLPTTPDYGIFELSGTRRDHHRIESHRNVVSTTASTETDLKSTTVQLPSTSNGQSSSLFQVPMSDDSKCMLPLFCSSRFVRNCITSEIIGYIPNGVRSQRMKSPATRSIETSHMRRQSFKNVFDSRAWGHDWDIQHRGLNASGN